MIFLVILVDTIFSVIVVPIIMAHTVRCCRLIVAEIVLRIPLMIKLLIIRKTTLTSSCGLLLLLYLEITGGCLVGLLVVMVAERP